MKTALFFTVLASALLAGGCVTGRRAEHSDVPIVRNLGFWAEQPGVSVDSLEVTVVEAKLHLLNSRAVIQYTISGSLKGSSGWRPSVRSLFVGQRYTSMQTPTSDRHAEIDLVPIAKSKEDKRYDGRSIPFTISVQEVLQTGGWGRTVYSVRCAGMVREFELYQDK